MIHAVRGTFLTMSALAAIAAGALALVWPDEAQAGGDKPQRIVSMNLCVDQIVLDLVPRERLAGLSFLAADPTMSLLSDEAAGIASVQGTAEEILALEPDLVLAGEYTTGATVDLLRRLGRRVEVVPMASSFSQVREVVRRIAAFTGDTARGEELIADFDQRLQDVRTRAVAKSAGPVPRAVAFQVNSLASGEGSLVDEVLSEAGFANLARSARVGPGGRLPLESLISDPPDLIVRANSARDFRTVLGDNLRHPAFLYLEQSRPSVDMPMNEWLCGTTRIVQAVERLAGAREQLNLRAEAER